MAKHKWSALGEANREINPRVRRDLEWYFGQRHASAGVSSNFEGTTNMCLMGGPPVGTVPVPERRITKELLASKARERLIRSRLAQIHPCHVIALSFVYEQETGRFDNVIVEWFGAASQLALCTKPVRDAQWAMVKETGHHVDSMSGWLVEKLRKEHKRIVPEIRTECVRMLREAHQAYEAIAYPKAKEAA